MQKYTDEIDAHEAQASEIYTSGVRNEVLEAMFQRRAIKAFEPVEIPQGVRERILDAARHAPSSFNMQPYRFIWVESPERRATAAKLCMGQMPAETASALVVAVADIGSFRATAHAQAEWMRKIGFGEAEVQKYERTAKIGRILFMSGPLGIFGALKWAIFGLLNVWKTMGMPPVFRKDVLKWATKGAALACENLMIAAEALGLNTCPMEGFDSRRLGRFLGLSSRHHEIVMVIAVGKRSLSHAAPPQWRRPLEKTVTVL